MNRLFDVQPIPSTSSSSSGGGIGSRSGVGSGGGYSLLRNMGVLTVILDLLQIPYDQKEDVRMNELMRLAKEFLQTFCQGNQTPLGSTSQTPETFTHSRGDIIFLNILLIFKLKSCYYFSCFEAQTVCAIFQGNVQ